MLENCQIHIMTDEVKGNIFILLTQMTGMMQVGY